MTVRIATIQNTFWRTLAHTERQNVSKVGIYSIWSLLSLIVLAIVGLIIGDFILGDALGLYYVISGLLITSFSTVGLYKGIQEKGRKRFRIPGFVINIALIAISWWIVSIAGTLLFIFAI